MKFIFDAKDSESEKQKHKFQWPSQNIRTLYEYLVSLACKIKIFLLFNCFILVKLQLKSNLKNKMPSIVSTSQPLTPLTFQRFFRKLTIELSRKRLFYLLKRMLLLILYTKQECHCNKSQFEVIVISCTISYCLLSGFQPMNM